MELYVPSYYKNFRCLGGDCPDTCCQEWDVEVDPDTAARYLALPGELGAAVRQALKQEDGEWYLENKGGFCPLLREDGLCRLQAALGEKALGRVCREFPRLRQDYGTFAELGLEMSCPEAARIILETENWTLEKTAAAGGQPGDYDPELMAFLQKTRPGALQLLADRSVPVQERLALLLLYGHRAQALLDGEEEQPSQEELLEEARKGTGDLEGLLAFYGSLEILTDRWRELLASPRKPQWTEALCRFAAYGICRYYYQAVSDWDLAPRIQMIGAAAILGAYLPGACTETLYLYSKEIENDADNVDCILEAACHEGPLSHENLLRLLQI